ncbi:hypothetical protein Y032_0300g1797 [Ancylostoma ceylanicum]|uniref:Reverse transcriptase domain-containing protein n=1 Tax=Ancylostoma ceylanicum TaxID=53326 RepID=A0A016S3T8_9BILA|nr:hypothetical protein Y032_0300g1797 [Ancylostoma ceylanicum]
MDLSAMPKTHPNIEVAAYADDIKVFGTFDSSNKDTVFEALNRSICVMNNWANTWDIKINFSKSYLTSFGSTRPEEIVHTDLPLNTVQSNRDLGIIIQNDLRFSIRVDNIVNRAKKAFFLLFRNVHCIDVRILVRLFGSCILPLVEYSSQVWNPHLKKDIEKSKFTETVHTTSALPRLS